jgi:hypothetical protein
MRSFYEYGVLERIYDIFRTLDQKVTIPPNATLVLDLLGVDSNLPRAELMTFFINLCRDCSDVEEFEVFIITGLLPKKRSVEVPAGFVMKPTTITHTKLSFWAS